MVSQETPSPPFKPSNGNTREAGSRRTFVANIVTSAYGKENMGTFFTQAAKEKRVIYQNKQKSDLFIDGLGLQLLTGSMSKSLIRSVPNEQTVRNDFERGVLKSNVTQPKNTTLTGNTVTSIQASISKMLGIDASKSLPNVSILQTATPEIVSKLKNGQLSVIGQSNQNEIIQGAYDGKTGRIYLFADNIKKGEENAVFLHEVFHKRGHEVLGDNYSRLKSFVDGWESSNAGTVEKRIFDAAKSRADKSGETGSRYDDELIAYAIEEAVNAGIELLSSVVCEKFA